MLMVTWPTRGEKMSFGGVSQALKDAVGIDLIFAAHQGHEFFATKTVKLVLVAKAGTLQASRACANSRALKVCRSSSFSPTPMK